MVNFEGYILSKVFEILEKLHAQYFHAELFIMIIKEITNKYSALRQNTNGEILLHGMPS